MKNVCTIWLHWVSLNDQLLWGRAAASPFSIHQLCVGYLIWILIVDCSLPPPRVELVDVLNIQYYTHNNREFWIYASCHVSWRRLFKSSQFVTVRAVTCVKSINLILLKSFQTLLLVTIWKCQRDEHKRKQTLRFIRLDDTRGINKYLNIGLLWDNIVIN